MTCAARLFCGLLAALLAACNASPPDAARAEQAVYEAFFAAVAGDRNPLVYLAAATETVWFEENPFEPRDWDNYLDGLGGIPIELVEELYRVNRASVPSATNPRTANIEFLPADYARPSAKSGGKERCLIGEGQPNIGIRTENGRYFRAYFTVSRVAFSPDGTHALLKYSYRCAPMSGGGEFFASFKRDGSQWQPLGFRMLWIS